MLTNYHPLCHFSFSLAAYMYLSLSVAFFPFSSFFSLYVFQPTLARRQARCARAKYFFLTLSRDYAATFAYCSSEVQPLAQCDTDGVGGIQIIAHDLYLSYET